MTSIETYKENSGNLAKKNGFKSANAAVKITDSLKELIQEHMGSKDEDIKQSKAEHFLQMSMLRTANQRQDTKLRDMKSEIQTLIQALTNLTNKMVESSSSKQRGGGYRSVGGYMTDEDGNGDQRRRTTNQTKVGG